MDVSTVCYSVHLHAQFENEIVIFWPQWIFAVFLIIEQKVKTNSKQ